MKFSTYIKSQYKNNPKYSKVLQMFYEKNASQLLNPEQVLNKAKIFTFSDFGSLNKENTLNICNKEKIIFAFREGILFTQNEFHIFNLSELSSVISFPIGMFQKINVSNGQLYVINELVKNQVWYKLFNVELYEKLKIDLKKAEDDLNAEEQWKQEERRRLERETTIKQRKTLLENKKSILAELDKNGDGKIDLIPDDFTKILNKNQKRVIEIDKSYIHQFVKISSYIKTKKQNTQTIFESIRDSSSEEELNERVNLLKNQIHAYEMLVFHSINMIGALVSEDLITFYEIYESFDKLSMFNSNWENEVSEKLTNIGNKLNGLMYAIYNMEQNIVNELNHLSYVTHESFENLNSSVTSQLREIESSINTNNLLTGIQAYQLYKIKSNTKGLRS